MNIFDVVKCWVSILKPNNSEYFVRSVMFEMNPGWVPGKIENT